jgi:ATP-dependent helicase HrpB
VIPLPVDPYLPAILTAVRERRAVVVSAPPGAGKTTRVAPALSADGPVMLLQPRRVAARAIARRIADEQEWPLAADGRDRRKGPSSGRPEVGWHVRFERQYGPRTRLLVATEGILTARAQSDPLLSDFATIVIDEFHERSVHGDLAIALARQAWQARTDLRLVVMSATLDVDAVSAWLDGCPVVEVPGRLHPLDVVHTPGASLADAVAGALAATSGQVLVFLPGAPEIARALDELRRRHDGQLECVPLHGSLSADDQDDAIRETTARRVILATNLAETSLTVPGVTAVIDTGLQKVVRYDASRGLDRLETERIATDSAVQRAGRAGRLGPGSVWRLWDERDRLRPTRQPEIQRVDLAGVVMDVLAWGGTPEELQWFETPPRDGLAAAWLLLQRLGAVRDRRLTDVGEQIRRLPLPPRLARILVAARGAPNAAAACALLAERGDLASAASDRRPGNLPANTPSDLLSALDRRGRWPASLERAAREIHASAGSLFGPTRRDLGEADLRRALFAGYPDRVARRRLAGQPRVVLCSGHGAVLGPESGVRDGEFLIAIDVRGVDPSRRSVAGVDGAPQEARIRIASAVDREWLVPTATTIEHRFDGETSAVRALEQQRYDELVLAERAVAPEPGEAARLLATAWRERGLSADDELLLNRLRFAGMTADVPSLIASACIGLTSLRGATIASALSPAARHELDSLAPPALPLPSGRSCRLEYTEAGCARASVKLQELFGLADSPRFGPGRTPVQFALLAPNGRPVQTTQDLRSFWNRTYPDVRRELRGRYPRHPWPEDPWSAQPTARVTRKART